MQMNTRDMTKEVNAIKFEVDFDTIRQKARINKKGIKHNPILTNSIFSDNKL